MPKRITEQERQAVLHMLAKGEDRETIAASVGVTPGQVSAIAAHVKMGTYTLPAPDEEESREGAANGGTTSPNLLGQLRKLEGTHKPRSGLPSIFLGSDAETGQDVYWNPDPETGAANPHVLVLGESGFGKTYTISCLLGELAQHGILSIVFDYGQGFALNSLPSEFVAATKPSEILAGRDGIDINPLQIFPSDVLGPVNVAQRVADTFARVYPKIGVTSNRPIEEWGKLLNYVPAATAILDRFLHHAEIIQVKGRSYRLRHGGRSSQDDDEVGPSDRLHGKKK